MSNAKNRVFNAALVLASVAVVFLFALAADRVYGFIAPANPLPNSMELIFPPNAMQSFKSMEFEYTAHINQLGLREREIKAKQPGVFRICAIGDSYTYGWGVEAEQTWLRRLEDRLLTQGLKVETINLGKPGSGPDFYSEVAARAIPVLEPDLVIVGILMGNDVIASGPDGVLSASRASTRIANALFPNITRQLQRPKVEISNRTTEMPPQVTSAEDNITWTRNTAQDFLAKMTPEEKTRYASLDAKVRQGFESGLFNPYMVDLGLKNPENYKHTVNLDDPWIEQCVGAVAGHLEYIAGIARQYGANTVVAVLPDGPYVNDHALRSIQGVGYEMPPDAVDSDGPDNAIRNAAKLAGLPVISATAAFKKHRDDPALYFEFDGHMTAKGHSLYAESIADAVADLIKAAGGA